VVDDLTGPQIASFLAEHVREMLSITAPESKHALDLETLRGPGITFWSVMDGGTVVGCGALKRLDARHAEVKSMRTLAARQRSGIASMMLEHIIAEARRMGFSRLSLETGSAEFFAPARRLYEKVRVRVLRAVRRLPARPAERVPDQNALGRVGACSPKARRERESRHNAREGGGIVMRVALCTKECAQRHSHTLGSRRARDEG